MSENRDANLKMPSPRPADLSAFEGPEDRLEAKYGLPRQVAYCARCVISNQRPNSAVEFKSTATSGKTIIAFDEKGVCAACRVAEQKYDAVNWSDRERELRDLCDRHRRTDGRYDCIVPGSGGKDSFYAAHMLKYEYGMHPLTVTWAPHVYTDWGWKNFQSWIHAGFDNQLFTPNGRAHRLLTRLALENLFHPFQPFILGQKNMPPKAALMYDVRLVFFGENEAEYGNPTADFGKPTRDAAYFTAPDPSDVSISGANRRQLKDQFGVDDNDLLPYLPAERGRIEAASVEVHYLGYYLKWHPQSCYYYAQEKGGFEPSPERTPGTYSKYNSIDDRIDDFHFYTTYVKFGIGRATYDAAQEIRSRDITREEGVALVRRFDGEFPTRFADEIFDYLSIRPDEFPVASAAFERPVMDKDYFMTLADRFRSPHLWKYENGTWSLRHPVWASGS